MKLIKQLICRHVWWEDGERTEKFTTSTPNECGSCDYIVTMYGIAEHCISCLKTRVRYETDEDYELIDESNAT